MLRTIRLELLAGVMAGFLAALLYVVDSGPGNSLHGVARWFALDSQGAGKFIGFLLMLGLGAIFGILFAMVMGKRQVTLGRSLGVGLLMGFTWWVVVAFLIGVVVNQLQFNLPFLLATFVPLLVYGLLLGSISYRWMAQQA